jgi:hypothetical protein
MGSFTSGEIVDQIILRNGEHFSDDGDGTDQYDYVKIVAYTTPEGRMSWGAVLRCEVAMGLGDRYDNPSEYIRNPKVIWARKEPA